MVTDKCPNGPNGPNGPNPNGPIGLNPLPITLY